MSMPKQDESKDLKKSKLGQIISKRELDNSCKAVFGGVSWPGRRPGFVVVIAMEHNNHFDNHDVCLLDEFESIYSREIVRKCGVYDFQYSPKIWIGDWKNDAASRFIQEMNSEHENQRQQFSLNSTSMLEMKQLYPYILGELKRLLDPERRQLHLKDSKIVSYLSEIKKDDIISDLQLGDYPAVEALAFAVIEMRKFFSQDEDFDHSEKHCETGYENYHPLHSRRSDDTYSEYNPLNFRIRRR